MCRTAEIGSTPPHGGDALPPAGAPEPGSHWLLFLDRCGLGEELAQQLGRKGVHVTRVHEGSLFRRQGGEYTLDPARRGDYDLLIRDLSESGRVPRVIVHLWNVTPQADAPPDPIACRTRSFYSPIFLTQALGNLHLAGPCHLALVSNHLHDVTGAEHLDPAKALLLGPVAVIPQEYSHITCSSVDVDLSVAPWRRDNQVELLAAEAAASTADPVIAYRGSHRWVQAFVPVPLDRNTPSLRRDGVYLITGGTGGVGLALAEWLARKVPGVKLALTARSELPPREEWETLPVSGNASRGSAAEPCGSGRGAIINLGGETHRFAELEAGLKAKYAPRPAEPLHNYQKTVDHLCALYIGQYLRQGGIDLQQGRRYSRDQIRSQLRIRSEFDKFLSFFLRVLSEEGLLAEEDGCVVVKEEPWPVEAAEDASREARLRLPDFAALDDLLRHCVRHYGPALSGEIETLSVLYPDGELDLLGAEGHFTEKFVQRAFSIEMFGEMLGRAVRNAPGKRIRILEVGAGSGELTFGLVQRLRAPTWRYWFTDVGRAFVMRAEKKAAELGFEALRFGVLDISRDPVAQGYKEGRFDIIIALDVVHATPKIEATLRNLKDLLAPEGLLCLLETVKARRQTDMIWGLAKGWWSFEDDDLRRDSPLLSLPQWVEVLRKLGFPAVEAWPAEGEERAASEFGLILAQNRGPTDAGATDRWLTGRLVDPAQRLSRTIGRLKQLEDLGAEVLVLRADVSDPVQMRSVVGRIRQRFGDIHGVIHAAGIAGGGTIQFKGREDAEREFAARIDGSLVLEDVLADSPLDFFVLCSSHVSVTGGLGLVAYSAACAFQDAWAQYRASRGDGTRTIAIDWDRWQGLGMAVAVEARHRELTGQDMAGGIRPADAAEAFGRILSSAGVPCVVVSTRDFPSLVRQSRSFQLGRSERQTPPLRLHARPDLTNDYIAPSNDTERLIGDIWQEELGIERVGVRDDFFALGGDSLIAIKLVSRLQEALGVPLSVRTPLRRVDGRRARRARRVRALGGPGRCP